MAWTAVLQAMRAARHEGCVLLLLTVLLVLV